MTTTHTPGPWKSAVFTVDDAHGLPVADVLTCKADVDLIASAPDMLAALEAILAEVGPVTSGPGTVATIGRLAVAAIAKARGAR